jgi:phosphohistidine phosphatase
VKRLTVVRHAKANWGGANTSDFDRALSKIGEMGATLMGKRLAAHLAQPDLVLSSPAKRAADTALKVAEEMGLNFKSVMLEPKLYGAEAGDILDIVQQIDSQHEQVIIFGHNPGVSDLGRYLTNKTTETLPPGGAYCIDFDIASWAELAPGSGKLVFVDHPGKTEE